MITPYSAAEGCRSGCQMQMWVTTAALTALTSRLMKAISGQVSNALTRLHN